MPIGVSNQDTVAGFNIYGEVIGGFGDVDEQLCQVFAQQVSVVVSDAQSYWSLFELSENLSKAMESRAVISPTRS
jgi:hypothetical protein